jgi:hypothetical protein
LDLPLVDAAADFFSLVANNNTQWVDIDGALFLVFLVGATCLNGENPVACLHNWLDNTNSIRRGVETSQWIDRILMRIVTIVQYHSEYVASY